MLRVLYDPDNFFREFRGDFKIAIGIVALSGILSAIIAYLRAAEMIEDLLKNYPLSKEQVEVVIAIAKVQAIVSPIIGAFVGWILITLIVHALSALFGGEGEFSKTLKYTSFSYIPAIILSPLNYIYFSATPTTETLIIGLATMIWQAYILIFAVKHARRIETRKAVICVIIPFAISYTLSFIGYLLIRGGIR